jgi:hypothetical protein
MPLTKLFKDTVKARIERDPAFAAALFEEALSAFFEGDTALGKALLRDLVNSTIGFAVALQSGAFAVTRFSLAGAKPAIERALLEAANSKNRQTKPSTPKPPPSSNPRPKDIAI